jgi:Domain of unknown function (DUF4091)
MKRFAIILGLLFCCSQATHAQTFVRASTLASAGGATGTAAFTSNTATNKIIVEAHGSMSGSAVPTVTDTAGNTYALVAVGGCDSTSWGYTVFEADNIAASAGPNTLTITPQLSVWDGVAFEYSGLASPVAFDQMACAFSSVSPFTSIATLQTTVNSDLLTEDMGCGATTPAQNDGSTTRFSGGSNWIDVFSDRSVSIEGQYATTGTRNSGNCIVGIATWKVAGSAVPAGPTFTGTLAAGNLPSMDTNCAHAAYNANVWLTNTLQKVKMDTGGAATNSCTLLIYCTPNEFCDFQVHFHDTGSGTAGLKVTVNNFVQTTPASATINCATLGTCVVYRESSMNVTTQTALGSTFYMKTGLYPDRLIPAVDPYWGQTTNAWPFTVPASNNQSAWIDVLPPIGALSGYYLGSVVVQTGCPGSCVTISTNPVTIGVVSWLGGTGMPSTTTLRAHAGQWSQSGCVLFYNADGSSSDTTACDPYPDGGTPTTSTQQIWEDATLFMKDHRFAAGGYADLFPDAGSFTPYVTLISPNMNGTCRHSGTYCPLLVGAKQRTSDIIASGFNFTSAIFSNFQTGFDGQSWGTAGTLPLDDYLFDEPHGASWTTLVTNGSTRHSWLAPSIEEMVTANIADATSNSALSDIDILSPLISDMEPVAASGTGSLTRSTYNTWLSTTSMNCGGGANQACGPRAVWEYQSCTMVGTCTNNSIGVGANTYPNLSVDGKPAANRAMEWLDYINSVSGELYYGQDICWNPGAGVGANCGSPTNPCVSVQYSGQWGDGNLIYPGSINASSACYVGAGVTTPIFLPSVRLKHMRDGMQDYEILNVLNNNGQGGFINTTISPWIRNSYTFDSSGVGLMNARLTLLAKMQSLSNGIGVPAAPSKLGVLFP